MRRGFTLVEMLVVLGIIAVLMGASIGGFSAMRKSAEKAKCQELVHNTATALETLFIKLGSWPKRLRTNGKTDGILDENAAYPLAKGGYMSLTISTSDEDSDGTDDENAVKLGGVDKFGVVTPWALDLIKAKGKNVSASSKVPTGGTVSDHRLHYALDLDGDGIVEASVGGQSVRVRANAIVWCCGRDGVLEKYSDGLRKDDVYSWSKTAGGGSGTSR